MLRTCTLIEVAVDMRTDRRCCGQSELVETKTVDCSDTNKITFLRTSKPLKKKSVVAKLLKCLRKLIESAADMREVCSKNTNTFLRTCRQWKKNI